MKASSDSTQNTANASLGMNGNPEFEEGDHHRPPLLELERSRTDPHQLNDGQLIN